MKVDKNNLKLYPPGSKVAVEAGCVCPVMDNNYGAGYYGQPGVYVVNGGCKLHDTDNARRKGAGKNG